MDPFRTHFGPLDLDIWARLGPRDLDPLHGFRCRRERRNPRSGGLTLTSTHLGGRGGPDSSYEKRDPGYPDLYLTPGSGPYGPSEDLELGTLYKVLGVDEHERTSDLEIRPLDLEI